MREIATWFSLRRQRCLLAAHPWVRRTLLAAVLLFIPLSQWSNYQNRALLSDEHRIYAMAGNAQQWEYAYLFHYLGLYPVTTRAVKEPIEASLDGARGVVERSGYGLFARTHNEQLSIFPYLVDIWLGADPRAPSTVPGAAIGFTVALAVLYVGFWLGRLELLGLFLVVLFGSDQFQLNEVYRTENVFSWPRTVGMIVMGLYVPLLTNPEFSLPAGPSIRRYFPWAVAVIAGLAFGTFRHMRPETMMTLPVVILALLLLVHRGLKIRVILIGVLLGSFFTAQGAWSSYFRLESLTAYRIVTKAGGQTEKFLGDRPQFHMFWHPVWCGLGDFDDKYGYLFDDDTAIRYATPRIGPPGTSFDMDWGPEYSTVLRDKVLHDVLNDPLWYARIQFKRLWRVVFDNTPPQAVIGGYRLDLSAFAKALPFFAGLCAVGLLLGRQWRLATVGLFPLGMGGVVFMVTSAGGAHYYAALHLFIYAFTASLAIESVLALRGRLLAPPFRNK